MTEELLTITRDLLETGMRGYPVGYCTTSSVDPQSGLIYIDKPVPKLAYWKPEQVIYLLYTGREGSQEEVRQFTEVLRKRAQSSSELLSCIRQLPRKSHPMKLFASAILLAGTFLKNGDYREDCLNLIAQIPIITAEVINHHAGWGASKPSKPELGYIENFVQMLNTPNGDKSQLTEAFNLFNILHYDHGGGNLSTFVGKAIASSLADMYESLCGAMCALAGPKHGKANQDCLAFVQGILDEVGPDATGEEINKLITRRLANNELIFGFGHAVLRVEDPRATIFYELADKKYREHPLVKIAHLLRTEGPKILKQNPKISNPYPNVDAVSGILLTAAGFPYSEYYTVLFGMARVVGISIQIVYERCEAREGKGTPIVRPRYLFKKR